jgi:AraC family transcriptional regulator, chitin signaling transcriptional activator
LRTSATYFLVLILGTLVAFAQKLPEKGVPLLQNFSPSQYYNKGKIWDIGSNQGGMIYMAADQGLLEYDGKTWSSFTGSTGFTRSLLLFNDSVIFTGSDLDFGVWRKNEFQSFEYSSLYPFKKDIQNFYEEFWDVRQVEDNIVFVSSQNIYIFRNEQLIKISAPYRFTGSFTVNDSLYFADEKLGLFLFTGYSLKEVFKYPNGIDFLITGIYHDNQGIVIVTRDSGIYLYSSGNLSPLNNTLSQKLKNAKVFSFEQIDNTHLAFGTVLNGLFITDLSGKIIHHINKNKGLPNNTILSLHYSPFGKLWLGMDYGVSVLDLQNNFTYFFDYGGDFGTGYAAMLIDETFYLGTNQGLYTSSWEDLNNDADIFRLKLVKGTEGQVWALENIDNTLYIGHDRGLFVLRGSSVQELSTQDGVWTILPYNEYLLTGNYNGISIFKKTGENYTFLKKMELILGSCNQIIIEKENILWVNIPNFGIIRAVLDNDLFPSERLIFPDSIFQGKNLSIVKNEEGLNVLTDNRQYAFNEAKKEFLPKNEIIGFPKVENLLPGIYQPLPLNYDFGFLPVYNGFALKSLHVKEGLIPVNKTLVFRNMEAFNNHERTFLFPGALVPYRQNNLRIELIIPNQAGVLYQYKFDDSENWSHWQTKNFFEFYNLKFGSYNLMVRAKINEIVSEAETIAFRIATPWHQKWYAYLFYFAMLAAAVYFFGYWQKVTLKKQRKELLIKQQNSLRHQAEKHRQEIMLLEQERLKNEYDLLKQQLKSKTIELANKAKDNDDKNRILLSLKEKFNSVQKDPCKSKLNEIRRMLDSYLKIEDNTFEIQMDELHQEFSKKLKDEFPSLSVQDLRLCAYLKIGLNSKEIADILNILPSSAFISRSRLRKKLNLKPEEDLIDFLNSF